jgi:DNA-binding response OmpR family regulator
MRVLCVARHKYLTSQLCDYFTSMGLEVHAAVGIEEATKEMKTFAPDLIVCDFSLLATLSSRTLRTAGLSTVPIIAASLAHRVEEVEVARVKDYTAGYLYLPTCTHEQARCMIEKACAPKPAAGPTPTEQGPDETVWITPP